MANLNTDLVRDQLVEAIWESYRKGWLNEAEYDSMMSDFSYHFNQMSNVIEERRMDEVDTCTEYGTVRIGSNHFSSEVI